ncbi:hypothetical protein XENOCAPTIV_001568 [Xenoophorus captivus]|uniref:Uncharacterized protein n=1 Tax=Xenoophorus captivus TaxID=1517983 RepID=A0ABV0RG49_9TELE
MKRSQRFSSSFSFEEDQQPNSKDEEREEEALPPNYPGGSKEVVESKPATDFKQMADSVVICDSNQPRFDVFRPQQLCLAMTRCLSLQWMSISRQSICKSAYQGDLNQYKDTQSSVSSDSTNESSSTSSASDDKDAHLSKPDDISNQEGEIGPPLRRGISQSCPRLPRTRQATDLGLASVILEKEMFLRIELVDSGNERGNLQYRAEWTLSEKTKDVAKGVWLSQSQKVTN